MKLLSKQEFVLLRSEISEYINLCNEHNYTPSKADIKDIIEFSIDSEPNLSSISESYQIDPEFIVNHIYESYELDEAGFRGDSEYDNTKDFESAVGAVKVGANMAMDAVKFGAGLAFAGSVILIGYMFKRGKVRSLVKQELDSELKKLQGYQSLYQLKRKLSDLKGEAVGKVAFPTMATGPELEQPQPE